jgi:hypothetical protein
MNQAEETEIRNSKIETSPAVHRWRMAFFGLVILLAGMVIGTSVTLSWLCHTHPGAPGPSPEFAAVSMVGRLQDYLDLSPEQTEKLEPILRKHLEQLYEIRIGARSKIEEQLRQMNTEISSILGEGQKQLWHEHLQGLQQQLRPGPAGPPGPPRRGPYRHRGRGLPPNGLSPDGLWEPHPGLRYFAPLPPSLQGDVPHLPELQKD